MPGILSEGAAADSVPSVQDTEEADLRAQMLGVGGDDAQRLRCGTEQDIVDPGLVLERDGGDEIGHGEHDVEIRHLEQFRLTILQPLRPRHTLALRTVMITARVV